MSRSQYVYIIWGSPSYCYDECCDWVAGVYTVKKEAEAGLEKLESEADTGNDIYNRYRVEGYRDGIQGDAA